MVVATTLTALLVGCASPGPPLPPSLKLPEVVTDLTATRVGDSMTLRWTTPSRTTDKLLIAGSIEAEICREETAVAAAMGSRSARKTGGSSGCAVADRVQVSPGESEAVDTLPASLTAGPLRVLAYRVRLLNAAGRTAGPSQVALAAAGPAPEAVQELRGTATKRGVMLEWRPSSAEAGGGEAVELDRVALEPPAAAVPVSGRKGGLPAAPKEPADSRLRAGTGLEGDGAAGANAGGTVDRTAQLGRTYGYTAQRVRSVKLGGQTLELRSVASAQVTVAMRDVFPPEAPVGLVAVPGFAGGGETQKPAIDLSWDPNMEPRIAGYRVYRRDMDGDAPGAWRPLTQEPVRAAAYSDRTVVAGRTYSYRVTAVNEAGNESAPSGDVTETAPAQ